MLIATLMKCCKKPSNNAQFLLSPKFVKDRYSQPHVKTALELLNVLKFYLSPPHAVREMGKDKASNPATVLCINAWWFIFCHLDSLKTI